MDYFKLARFFLYAAIFSVVLVTSSTLFPFIVGKYVFFRICVGLAVIAFSLGLVFKDENDEMLARMKGVITHPLAIGALVYVATFVVAGFFGVNPTASFWSNFERGEGGLQLLNLGAFFFMAVVLFKDWKAWRRFFIFWIVSSALVMLYGVGAGLGINGFVGQSFSSAGLRFAGSLGNPAYVGTFMLFTMAFALISAFRAVTKQEKNWFLGIAVVSLLASWSSQTRGAFLGLVVGLFFSLFFIAFNNKHLRKKVLGVLAGLVIVSSLLIAFRTNPTLQKIPGFRVFTISLQEQTAQTRLWTWNSALQGFKERPIFGWGPENFSMVFDKYFDHRHFDPVTGGETWFDRAHSLYFDALVGTGIVGIVGLLGMIFSFFYVWKKTKDTKHISLGERAVLLGIMIAYLVQGIVLFDIFPSYLALFTLLAYTTSRTHTETK
ncbi:O-antigen ligase family protein [Candidatus Parcubacteria bacterium]|jgi:O-antigen ligase|nr:MAG: O-antigen ligase family protein [Candidatus Parcubacteria bacterium]